MPYNNELSSVAIIMCTHNGADFIKEQLDSIAKQTHTNWKLYVYDDSSNDHTVQIITDYAKMLDSNKIHIISVQHGHFAKNFLSAIYSTPDHYDFYAFADQDDIWLNNKLETAILMLRTLESSESNLYCSRTELVDSVGNHIGFSPLFTKKPSFENAIIQSIAGGNTMVFNKAAKYLICSVRADLEIVSHDWWLYQLITATGGNVLYDSIPHILYRQHGRNLIGSNNGFMAKITRFHMLLNGQFKSWNSINIEALNSAKHLLTRKNLILLTRFIAMRNGNILSRIVNFCKSGIYRQTLFGSIALFIGVLINKV